MRGNNSQLSNRLSTKEIKKNLGKQNSEKIILYEVSDLKNLGNISS